MKGIPAAPGLASGHSLRWNQRPLQIPKFTPADLLAEKQRLESARGAAAIQLNDLAARITAEIGAEEGAIFEAQAMFLEDVVLIERAGDAIAAGQNAEQAWHDACEYFATQLESIPDETLRARSADVRDIGRRVIELLTGVHAAPQITTPVVILARDLAPSQTALLDKTRVLAFCTAEGGPTSHTAILARALGIPAVVGLGAAVLEIPDATMLLVDGHSGDVTMNPGADMKAAFKKRLSAELARRALDHASANLPAVTRDGHRVEIVANVGSVDDAQDALNNGAEGIGLLRTEFLFLNRTRPPDEQTQYAAYRAILEQMGGRPVVVRTLDVGGDKEVPYLDFGFEANPFLGYRAIRISLDHPQDFKVQLRALLRAGAGHDLRIMFPMIATLDEVASARAILLEAQQELVSEGADCAQKVQTGIMVEIPSVSIMADRFASQVDFFSIGTNDLTQYTFAAERGNRHVARLNDPCHPAILRQIEQVVTAAHRAGIWVGVCGEMAGDLQAVPVLVGLGVDELSMVSRQIPAVKQVVRTFSLAEMQALAGRVMAMESAEEIRQAARDFLSSSG